MKFNRKDYEEYLNELYGHYKDNMDNEMFIIGGKVRRTWYGTALRKYDPIAFQCAYNEFINI